MNAQKGFSLIETTIVVAIIGVLAGVAALQYQTYITKAQFTRVMAEAAAVRTAVDLCISEGKRVVGAGIGQCDPQASGSTLQDGAGNGALGHPLASNQGVPDVSLADDGSAAITSTFGHSAASVLKGRRIVWLRTTDGGWTCTSDVESRKYAAADCLLAAK